MKSIRALLIGDVVGTLGCALFQKHAAKLKERYKANILIVNGENSGPRGRGITSKIVDFFKHNHADVITSGNHIWAEKDIYGYFEQGHKDLLRPANFPAGTPGSGVTVFMHEGIAIGVMNLQGRVLMPQQLDDPFRCVDTNLSYLKHKTNIIFVDFHAETTAEKMGFAYYVDGRVSCVVGTHTHVQTADERILPKGTAYITDLGMAGSLNSMIGMKKESILEHMKTQMPAKFEIDTAAPGLLSGVVVEVDVASGRAISIERVRIIDEDITV